MILGTIIREKKERRSVQDSILRKLKEFCVKKSFTITQGKCKAVKNVLSPYF